MGGRVGSVEEGRSHNSGEEASGGTAERVEEVQSRNFEAGLRNDDCMQYYYRDWSVKAVAAVTAEVRAVVVCSDM